MTKRTLKFAILEHLVAPAALLVLKLLVRSYRICDDVEQLRAATLAHPRIIIATCHGMWIALLPYVGIFQTADRQFCVMTSPSRDGRLLDAALESLGMVVVKGSSKSRSATGAVGLVDAVKQGYLGLLAVDGPKGPAGIPKPGFIRLAPASDAVMLIAVVGAKHCLKFRSWDRLFVPLPFSRIELRLHFYKPGADTTEAELHRLQLRIESEARAVGCPIFQPSETNSS